LEGGRSGQSLKKTDNDPREKNCEVQGLGGDEKAGKRPLRNRQTVGSFGKVGGQKRRLNGENRDSGPKKNKGGKEEM